MMRLFSSLHYVLYEPSGKWKTSEKISSAGKFGFLAGILGLFAWFYMFSGIPSGVFSFLVFFLIALASDFFSASVTHMLIELVKGGNGGASPLFYSFGLSDMLFSFLVPLGMICITFGGGQGTVFFIMLSAVVIARVYFISRLYGIGSWSAFFSFLIPYAAVLFFWNLFMFYSIFWLCSRIM